MNKLLMPITLAEGAICIAAPAREIGSQYDDRAVTIEFTRPAQFQECDLLLYCSNGDQWPPGVYEPLNLGRYNEFILTSGYTQSIVLKLQVAFRLDGVFLGHSNVASLCLRPSLAVREPGVSIYEQLGSLYAGAFVRVREKGGMLLFENAQGEEIASVDMGGSQSPYLSAQNTWMVYDPLVGRHRDSGVLALGQQGEQGEAGPQGLQGETGPQGATGKQGERGPQGPQGETGERGLTGPAGEQGAPGMPPIINPLNNTWMVYSLEVNTYIPTETPATGPQGEAGPQGLPGEPGPQGAPGLPPMIDPQSNTWMVYDMVLQTYISTGVAVTGPQGETGPQGPPGADLTAEVEALQAQVADLAARLAAIEGV